jgi:YD repeat-containing protein
VEAYAFDNLRGVSTYRALNGTVTKKHYFMTKGPLWMKFRRQETLTNGQMVVTRRMDYDTAGRKLREINPWGTTEYVYQSQTAGTSNAFAAVSLGPKMQRKIYDSKGRLMAWQTSSNQVRRYTYPASNVVESVDTRADGSWTKLRVVGTKMVTKQYSTGETEIYDQAERLIETREANGSVEQYIRNAEGEIVRTLRDGKLYSRRVREPVSGRRVYVRYDEEGTLLYACDARTRQHLPEAELASLEKVLNERSENKNPNHKEML